MVKFSVYLNKCVFLMKSNLTIFSIKDRLDRILPVHLHHSRFSNMVAHIRSHKFSLENYSKTAEWNLSIKLSQYVLLTCKKGPYHICDGRRPFHYAYTYRLICVFAVIRSMELRAAYEQQRH